MAGRAIIHAGLAGDHPIHRFGPLILAAGTFFDAVRVTAAADGSLKNRFYLDSGVGIRIGVADRESRVIRIDLARRLQPDRRSALTVGAHRSWPHLQPGSR
jgi:hypothetical protein